MSVNYDNTSVGVPYVRGTQVVIDWPDSVGGPTRATVSQCTAVRLADNSIRNLDVLPNLNVTIDFAAHGNDPIPLVDPSSGANLGATTTLNQVMLGVLAVVRQYQKQLNN